MKKITIILTGLLFLTVSCSKILLSNVPEDEYTQKVESILTMDEKNDGHYLWGWTYEKIDSSAYNLTHRYYYFPSKKENAPVLIFLHGLSFDGLLFINLRELSSEYELISYDFPEKTELYTGSMEDFVRILSDFFTEMNIDNVVLVGASFGGIIAIKYYASERPVNIKKIVLIATLLGGTISGDRRRTRMANRVIDGLPDYKLYFLMEWFMKRDRVVKETMSIPDMNEFMRMKNMDWYRQLILALDGYNAGIDALEVECPVLAIHGDNDETVNVDDSMNMMKTYISNVEYIVIPDGNHGIAFEKSTEVAEYIRQFLN